MRASLAVWGPLSGPRWGPEAKPLVGVQEAKPPETLVFFNAETVFSTQTYVHKVVTVKDIIANEIKTSHVC